MGRKGPGQEQTSEKEDSTDHYGIDDSG
jgi:hypothetical protein